MGSRYIPVGCLVISRDQYINLKQEFWSRECFHQWHAFPQQWEEDEKAKVLQPTAAFLPVLPRDVQSEVFAALRTAPLLPELLRKKWISFEVCVCSSKPDTALLRVYVLPDDVDNLLVDRSDIHLKKARKDLLANLDYSQSTWAGTPSPSPRSLPEPRDPDMDQEESLSLLEMFNNIPSPDPFAERLLVPLYEAPLNNLLQSEVAGLNTTLYPYQRRSAAVMLMREVQSAQDIDPRLVRVKDQADHDWFYDAPAGVVLKEPRYYDRVRGGILAEQMGSGKTLICLALILATRSLSAEPPALRSPVVPATRGVRSLVDMAAACATSNGAPWKWYFGAHDKQQDVAYENCLKAIERNPGAYTMPSPDTKRPGRVASRQVTTDAPKPIFIGHGSVVVVPNNLMRQWEAEIRKHTTGLKTLKLEDNSYDISPKALAHYDLVLVPHSRLNRILRSSGSNEHPLTRVLFKRCIVDEGHMLGNYTPRHKSDLLLALDQLHASARWIVTGTPSRGLYGVDGPPCDEPHQNMATFSEQPGDVVDGATGKNGKSAEELERRDLIRIGAIASLYLKIRPWANTTEEGETPAKWSVYVMQPKHTAKGSGRQSSLRGTLNSLIVRHRLSELSRMLPTVDDKVVLLDGSYQDKLSINVFSVIIIFNAVQSQRTDRDYMFHPSQRKSLLLLVQNLRVACFFGGHFFPDQDVAKALETATNFLEEKKVPISEEDEALLRRAIEAGQLALENELRRHSHQFHEMPVFVRNFLPNGAGQAWSLDGNDSDPVCTNTTLIMDAQKIIRSSLGDPTRLNSLLNGGLLAAGRECKSTALIREEEADEAAARPKSLAGDTNLGSEKSPKNLRSNVLWAPLHHKDNRDSDSEELPEAFAKAELISTASAKMSYLLDSIIEHQEKEQIIVFYENENMAWYVAGMLDVIGIRNLIYAKSLSSKRKDQYINTFNNDTKFRVLLMDLTQAAFGLDMRAASRIYFMHPILNPQVQAQAIGRVRRISQQKPVTVETLVLRDSIEEVIVERKNTMSQAEHWKCKSLLDDRPIYNWILNASITPMPEGEPSKMDQMVPLKHPQPIFRGGFGREVDPDEGLWVGDKDNAGPARLNGLKRPHPAANPDLSHPPDEVPTNGGLPERPARRVRFG
ncbi:hypothetical protein SODALDRAFT_324956 [Sodiomyces alkalinus F11]|uniref:Helicase C-terminal domain-containing protein n=1 Tax=Sodiomyces alkalinus (strain CBS 110278 / VKM F-3762 / F11) TaxID=1314773 RepID=A0A3N2PS47_SODAK|nr:hypothetical protein SODALDRAFT_324956 [Sodiomyces alkalinus F11]ROT37333.1 hypothetical protein SODALDRAFT_324956 [Sodiomyces alkalinus F11]